MKKYKTFDEYCASRAVRERVERQEMIDPTNGIFYFAYGSNLNVEEMGRRCPGAKKLQPEVLKHGKLVFRNVADLMRRNNETIQGGLWLITPEHEERLDAYEGVASKLYIKRYYKKSIKDVAEPVKVLYYQMSAKRGIMPPTEAYYERVKQGYLDFGLPLDPLEVALNEAWEKKNVTPLLRERHKRRGGQLKRRPTSPLPLPLLEQSTVTEGTA